MEGYRESERYGYSMEEIWRVRPSSSGTTTKGCCMRSSVEARRCGNMEVWWDLGP